jgi:mannitol-1-phosphate/altronate dehydrogenase
MGYTGVAEAIEDPLLAAFIRQYYMEEITATLPPVEGIDLAVYKDTLISRFSNRNIADTILRLASDGSKKIPNAILRPLAHTLRNGQPHQAIVLSLAAWARFLAGTDEAGKFIPLEDPNAAPLVVPAAKQARQDPAAFLRAIGITEADIAPLVPVFADFLERVYTRGMRKTLTEFLGATGRLT